MKARLSRSALLCAAAALVLLAEGLWSAVYFSLSVQSDILYYLVCLVLAFGAFAGLYALLLRWEAAALPERAGSPWPERLVCLGWFMLVALCFYRVRYAPYQELLYLPWQKSKRLALLVSLGFGAMLLLVRQMILSGATQTRPVRLWPWYALLTALCAYATYNPDCFTSWSNTVHRTAYFQSVYRVLHAQPYSITNCGTYGYYGLLVGPAVNLLGGTHTAFALVYAGIGAVAVAAHLFALDKLVKNQWLRLLGSLLVCLPYFGLSQIGYLQVTPHRLVFPALLLAALCVLKKRRWLYAVSTLFLATAFLWNFESGAACAVCLTGMSVYERWRGGDSPGRIARAAALRLLQIGAAFAGAYAAVGLYNRAVGGGWMSLSAFVFPYGSQAFAQQLELDLSLSLPSMWVLVCTLLVLCIGVALRYLFFRGDAAPASLTSFVGCVLVCAVQLVYYFNRSAESNLYICVPFAATLAVWLCEYLLTRPHPCGTARATAYALAAVAAGGALLSGSTYFGVQAANEKGRSKEAMVQVLDQLKAQAPRDTLAICHGMPEAYSELHWDTGFYGLQTNDFGILSRQEQEKTYRLMMEAPGVIVDDVTLSMVETHLGAQAVEAFYATHDLAYAFSGTGNGCRYFTRR